MESCNPGNAVNTLLIMVSSCAGDGMICGSARKHGALFSGRCSVLDDHLLFNVFTALLCVYLGWIGYLGHVQQREPHPPVRNGPGSSHGRLWVTTPVLPSGSRAKHLSAELFKGATQTQRSNARQQDGVHKLCVIQAVHRSNVCGWLVKVRNQHHGRTSSRRCSVRPPAAPPGGAAPVSR